MTNDNIRTNGLVLSYYLNYIYIIKGLNLQS